MKAVLIKNEPGFPLVYSDVPNPVIKPDEVLVEVHAAGINRADLLQREGNYPPPPGCPDWMGLEISGVIVKMGPIAASESKWKVGDKVCALLGGGGYAEYAAVRYDMLMPIPSNCTMIDAAGIPEAFATAYLNLFVEGGAKSGDTLLVMAGASGLASVIIPMAKSFGLRVITTVRKAHQVEAIAHLGADRIINTAEEDLPTALNDELESGHGVDIAIDCVGGGMMGKCLPYLNKGARWIMIAALAGNMTEIDLRNVYVRHIRIIGSTLRSRAPEVKAQILSELVERIYPKIESGEVKTTICAVFPIEEAEAGQAMLYDGKNIGKVILKVR